MSMLRRLIHPARGASESGQIIIMVGLAIIVLFGIVGLAIDVGRMYKTKAELSRSADAAALAGVLEIDGTEAGLDEAKVKAEAYFDENEPGPGVSRLATVNGDTNEVSVQASKSVSMVFMSVFGFDSATVSAKARAGFGNVTIDAALAIDSTSSMGDSPCNSEQDNSGCPIWEAKNAAKSFKDILLGASPNGNVAVGVAAWRGCFGKATPDTTAPMNIATKTNCVRHDTTGSSQVSTLITNTTTLNTMIDNISAIGGSGTNVCGGLSKAWEVLDGTGNHQSVENNRRYLILLSDGDNRYTGSYTYQASPASPHTYRTYSCQPPVSCSNVGGDSSSSSNPCYSAVHTPLTNVASDNFPSSCTNWNGGSGWGGAWALTGSGNDAPALITSSTPHDTSCHVRLRGIGTICRSFSLSSVPNAQLTYWAKYNSWESGDDVNVQVSTTSCSSGLTTLRTHTTGNTSTGYNSFTSDLDAYAGQATVYVRFEGSMSAGSTFDNFYIDTVAIQTGDPGSSDGYVNGDDNSSSCGSSVKRERQMDIRTWEVAKAIEGDNVEIFSVAFGVCSSNSTTYTQAQCDSQIGNTDSDSTADQRLMKCVASSADNTNDHYFYASSASALPTIFTTIAQNIAHRLVE